MAEPDPGNLWLGDLIDPASGEHMDAQLEIEAADVSAVHTALVWVRR